MNDSMSLFTPSDESSRMTILENLSQNIFVEAGAGTGKTTILVGRIVNLIESGLATIDSIAAITFTNAAAEELRIRIREELDGASQDETKSKTQRERASQGVMDIERATISTLHGFASMILKLKPLEAGLPPEFSVMDSVQSRLMFRKQFIEWRNKAVIDPRLEKYWLTFFAYGLQLNHIEKLSFDLLENSHLLDQTTNFWFDDRLPNDSSNVLIQEIQAALEDVFVCCSNESDRLFLKLQQFCTNLDSTVLENDELSNLTNLISCIDEFKIGNSGSKSNWSLSPMEIRSRLKNLINISKNRANQALSVNRFVGIIPLFESISEFVIDATNRRKILGRLAFSDLLLWARNLLRDDLEVRDYFRGKFTHLLIDEFQDTDPIQVEIAFFIAEKCDRNDPVRPTSWVDVATVPGKLFFVGDPQQSIYRFRNADIEILSDVQSVMRISPVKLSQNFRSQKPILDWVNYGFEKLIAQEKGARNDDIFLTPKYSPLSHKWEISKSGGLNSSVRYLGDPDLPNTSNRVARENEAIEVSNLLSGLKSTKFWVRDLNVPSGLRHAKFSDVAILIQNRTGLSVLENMLEEKHIPYRVEGGALTLNTQEVQDLVNCLKAIDDPSDEVSIVAALRSPGFACSDEELLIFKHNGGEFNYLESKLHRGSKVDDCLSELKNFHSMRMWANVSEFLKNFVKKRGLLNVGLSAINPSEFWRRIEFLIEQSEIFEKAGGRSFSEFLEWIEVLKEDRDYISSPVVEQRNDGFVRIMTVHASKGLEFPIVILTGLYNLNSKEQRPSHTTPVVSYTDKSMSKVQFGMGNSKSFLASYGFIELHRIECLKDYYESFRRLYVASTRACDHLILSMFTEGGKETLAMQIAEVFHESDEPLLWDHFQNHESQICSNEIQRISVDQNNLLSERDEWIEQRKIVFQRASDPNYLSATSLSKIDEEILDDQIFFESKTDGTEIGRAVHSVLEEIDLQSRDNLSLICKIMAQTEGISDRTNEIEKLVLSACDSDVVKRAIESGVLMREVPFSVSIASPNFPERTLEGYIDLLFEEGDGLIVVDYKTDAISPDNVQEVLSKYRRQGASYALGVEQAISKPVKEVIFLFLRSGLEERIENLGKVISELKSSIDLGSD